MWNIPDQGAEAAEGAGRPAPYTVGSADNVLRILLMFRETPSLRVADVAGRLGVARSTAHRLISTLCRRGFAVQDPRTRAYHPGKALTDLAYALARGPDLAGLLHRHLVALSALLGETVSVQVFQGADVLFTDGVEAERALKAGLRTGLRLPAYAASGGKAYLAELTREELVSLYPDGVLRRLTPHTAAGFDDLVRELAEVRERGYAVNLEGTEPGLHAVAVAVHDRTGRAVAALAVSAPAHRMGRERIGEVARALRAAAREVEREATART
ncbi:IclR family transcriptional regulator [Streptomyces sp. NPDC051662]|uniref:IclR family transcriptional regulator n=1 Tax=Streptomyces sp. NPDC051662 TaxID=3154750 RepID=UPI0034456575